MECLVSELFEKGRRQDISNDDMSKVLKLASIKLFYLEIKVIYIKDINTHSLRAGGGVVHLTGYKDREIQKWDDDSHIYSRNTYHISYINF